MKLENEMEFETLLYREENGVAYVTLNRPEVQNSFDYTMIEELAQVWQALRWNEARAVPWCSPAPATRRSAPAFDRKHDPLRREVGPVHLRRPRESRSARA